MLIAFWYARGLRSSDRFLYNYINLLLCSQSILVEWLRDSTWCICVCVYIYVCVCVRACAPFFVPTDIQKSNNVKLVQSSVPPRAPRKWRFLLCLPSLNVVVGVVNTAYALPMCIKWSPRFAVETRSLESLRLFR